MPGHCDKIRAQGRKINPLGPGTLGRVDHKGNIVSPAQGRQFFHRKNISEDIRSVGKHRGLSPLLQGLVKSPQGVFPVKELSARHGNFCTDAIQGAGHGIMLKAGNYHPHSGLRNTTQRHIQSVGTVGGEHHLLRLTMKEFSCQFTGSVHRLCRSHSRFMAAPAGIGTALQGPEHGFPDQFRFMQGCGATIQINHSATSTIAVSSCRYTFWNRTCWLRSSAAAREQSPPFSFRQ